MLQMANILDIINYIFVLFFGIVASLYLADISFLEHKRIYIQTLLFFGAIQILCYFLIGRDALFMYYPFLIHIPLVLVVWRYCHRSLSISAISVLSAYLLCTPRKWFGTFVAFFFDNNPAVSSIASILVTIPLLIFIIRFISPYVIRLKYESRTTRLLFFLLLLTYYLLEYAFTVYTNLLYTGGPIIIDFMDSFIVISYFILSMLSLKFSSEKNKAERENILLTTAAIQAQKEIARLSDSQKQASIYRHDLRHHMNYIAGCINKQNYNDAINYINEISSTLDNSSIIRYCVNEPINLIVSSYAEKAEACAIPMHIQISATDFSRFQITDLCSLFANALENALHACEQMNQSSNRDIFLRVYEKNSKLCINVINSFELAPIFENDLPISTSANHGIGVQSMVSVVEKYDGIYSFFADDGNFHFQASL